MPTPFGSSYLVDLGIKCGATTLVDTNAVVIEAIVPMAGKVKAIWVGLSKELPTTGTLAVGKSASTAVNLLAAATVNLAALTAANIAYSQTLAVVGKTLEVEAGTVLRAVWTLTNITHDNNADDASYACTVCIEPAVW
jgi:hypothetical protein